MLLPSLMLQVFCEMPVMDGCHEREPLPPSDSACQEGRSLGAPYDQASLPAFTAATYGRLTCKPGVCISTLGPGVLHFCFISKVLS